MQSVDDADRQLRNWARWAWDDDPKLGVPGPAWARDYRATAAWEAGWGDPGAPEALAPPVDERAAERVERLVLQLPPHQYRLVYRHYYVRAAQPELELQAALRALVDLAQSFPKVCAPT